MSGKPEKPALDPATLAVRHGAGYPGDLNAVCAGREKRALGDAAGLTNFGVNHVILPPGVASAHRHWHAKQDELIYVLEGEIVLVSNAGEQVLTPGMAAGFPAGVADGHQLVNRTDRRAVYLEVGDRTAGDTVDYPDIDLTLTNGPEGRVFRHKDGRPY
ncbi:MAG: cupin domain-containing protein [Alphaproteobacteria bacterium]